MKITHRLLLLIATAIAGSVFIGVMALGQLLSVNEELAYTNANTLPSLQELNKSSVRFLNYRILLLEHIAATEPAAKSKREYDMAQRRKDMEQSLSLYETMIADEGERKVFNAAKQQLGEFFSIAGQVITLSRQDRIAEAGPQLGALKKAGLAARLALEASVNYKIKAAEQGKLRAEGTVRQAKLLVGGAVLATLLLTSVLGWLIYRQISGGLARAQRTIGAIEASLDFTHRAEVKGRDEVSQTLTAFNRLIARLQDSLRELQQGVQEVGQSSAELLGASQQVARSSGVQSESSSHMAASVEQMTVSINHVAERAGEARQLSSEAGDRAESGRQVIGQTVSDIHSIAAAVDTAAEDIRQLDAKSKEIVSVINVIRDVADQTNLLALNAAIEAARAGETGRGFAVVADEVRKLAERTAASTQEIGTIIGTIQSVSGSAVERMQHAVARVEQGVAGANSAQQSMSSISDSSGHSVRLVSEITEAIREQGEATTTIAQQVEQVARMAEENSGAATQAAALAERLEEVSGRMHQVVSAYRL
ncbi:methyl-accepting chemotaxis protein [Pseudogulbenkiania sp. MAI-1]|uniref:methyl-accepting chemotaxis protein n=1 Tax=Pseudogulbenkiania sp. MAI-1 TaxID=990370 RepID=UPI00045EB65B|nr:methyl-accepting chemotaxis protein [Pseudogulbenkiania sp. MAI-1]